MKTSRPTAASALDAMAKIEGKGQKATRNPDAPICLITFNSVKVPVLFAMFCNSIFERHQERLIMVIGELRWCEKTYSLIIPFNCHGQILEYLREELKLDPSEIDALLGFARNTSANFNARCKRIRPPEPSYIPNREELLP
jgi:hypothetical protein